MAGPEIRIYLRNANGKLDTVFDTEFSFYGTCPSVGDILTGPKLRGDKPRFLHVVQRYFTITFDGSQGWTIVTEEREPTKEDKAVLKEYLASSKFWREVEEKETRAENEDLANLIAKSLPDASKPKRGRGRPPKAK